MGPNRTGRPRATLVTFRRSSRRAQVTTRSRFRDTTQSLLEPGAPRALSAAMLLDELDAWGLLPIAVPLLVLCAQRLAWLVFPKGTLPEQVAAACVFGMTLVHASVGLLGEAGVLSAPSLVCLLMISAAALVWATRKQSPARLLAAVSRDALPATLLLVGTLVAAVITARLLPVWQWDAFGYHLPFVNFVLQQGGFAQVPEDLRYISTYPHNIELGMIWLRAMLPDDRLVDLAQIPYGLAGALLTSAIARQLGATRALAALAGAAWLTLPAVFLQLPTNYVDVGTAAALLGALFFLVLSPITEPGLITGGLALGIFLGSKPSAPLAAVFLGAVALVRAVRAGELRGLFIAALATLVFGAQMYVVMWVRHGNPVWPVAVHLGPITLPGESSVDDLLAAGSALPRASGGLIERMSVSWLAIDTNPVFDMKLGGLGVLFLVALPLAVLGMIRRRALPLVLALAATLLSPDPSMPRYVLAFPALVIAIAAAEFELRARHVVTAAVLVLVALQLGHAWPGLVGDGPRWESFFALNDEERRVAIGPQGRPTDYPPAWAHVATGESVAFDADFEFPGLLWSPDLRYPVYAVPRRSSATEFSQWLSEHRVRLLAVGTANQGVLEREPDKWQRLFDCRSAACAVYLRR